MKKVLEKMEMLFAAISFAESGERDTARTLMEQKPCDSKTKRPSAHRGIRVTVSPARP